MGKVFLRPGTPDDDNRTYLPEEIIGTDIVFNENGNNSQPWPKRLRRCDGIVCDGVRNVWYEYVPESYDGKKPVPLVVSLHGGLMTGWGQAIYSSWTMVADREGFICIFPDATEMMFWTVEGIYESGGPTALDGKQVPHPPKDYRDNHDLNFIRTLIDLTEEKYNIDKSRIFMQGMSMGNMMTAQFSRYYGNILAGAAGAGAATWGFALFNKDGSVRNKGGAIPVWQSRPENNGFGMGDYEDQCASFNTNRWYWMKINECNPLPEISIVGEDNFAFYKGRKADLVYLDIKNRDHGQTLDEAFLYWDYFFSGLKRGEDGSIIQTEPNIPRKGDAYAAAFMAGVPRVFFKNQLRPLSQAPVRWQKLKYHGLNGGQKVRGEYTMVPIQFLAEMAGGRYVPSEDTLTAKIELSDGRILQFARGSIGCLINDKLRCMFCEALHRNGELLISAEWFAKYILNLKTTECNGILYITDHWAELSYYVADILKSVLENRYHEADYERLVKDTVKIPEGWEEN